MKGKIFTVEEARKTLPFVRQITGDILRVEDDLSDKAELHQALYAREDLSAIDIESLERLEADICNLRSLKLTYIEELEDVGCFVKSSRHGLVDWYAEVDGRIVYLCWRHGEEDVAFYHDLEGGFEGRRPIPLATPKTT
jgi:hypothetical protein